MSTDESSSAATAAKNSPYFLDCTNTFILSSTSNSERVLTEVPKSLALAIDPFRQRQAHRKSRKGCENCKRWRVKCNQEGPCASCKRRGVPCQGPVRLTWTPSIPSMPSQVILPSSTSTDSVIHLHLKLFHHFQIYTSRTLIFPPKVWIHAVQLCFKFDFLMHIILCVAARHLTILQPENSTYPIAAASHLSRTLSQFSHALTNTFTSTHVDAFIATSFLLQFEIWTNNNFFSRHENVVGSFDAPRDHLFAVSSSLKQVFLNNLTHVSNQPSEFIPHIPYDPRELLAEAVKMNDGTLAKYHDFFSYQRPLSLELLGVPPRPIPDTGSAVSNRPYYYVSKIDDALNSTADVCEAVITRLCLILSFLPQERSPHAVSVEPRLLPDLARYIFSFPVQCRGSFISMVNEGDLHALLLLYHFYRAVRILLPPEEYWWAHKRAAASESILREQLINESVKQGASSSLDAIV